jgi:hypothetical protein
MLKRTGFSLYRNPAKSTGLQPPRECGIHATASIRSSLSVGLASTSSRESSQALAKLFGISVRNQSFDLAVSTLPHRKCASHQVSPLAGERQYAAPPIRGVLRNQDQPAALQRLQCSGQRGPVHRQQRRYRAHRRRLRPIQGHQERKLPVCQPEWTQFFIEAPAQRARRALHMKTEAAIPHQKSSLIRKHFGA